MRARYVGTAATIVTGVGLAVATTGLVLWLTAGSEQRTTTVVPTASATGAGVSISGRF